MRRPRRDADASPRRQAGLSVAPLALAREEDAALVRERALELVRELDCGARTVRRPVAADIPTVVALITGVRPDPETHEFWCEEFPLGDLSRRADTIDPAALAATFPDPHVVIIGSGMGGISSAVMLQAAGIPFTIIEKNAGLGGTWYSNTYPGLRVDLPSRAYSFTFEPDYLWRHYFAPQAELLEYLEHTVDRRGLRERIVFETDWAWTRRPDLCEYTLGSGRAQIIDSVSPHPSGDLVVGPRDPI